jgi:hypothetical protein
MPLPVDLEMHCGSTTERIELAEKGGQVLLPLAREACDVNLTLPDIPGARDQFSGPA